MRNGIAIWNQNNINSNKNNKGIITQQQVKMTNKKMVDRRKKLV